MSLTSEEENLDMLLSLFAESESQEQETPAAGEGSDNLDDLFDEDDDGDPYIEPEEEDDVAPGKSSSAEGDSDLNKSKEDLEGKALFDITELIILKYIKIVVIKLHNITVFTSNKCRHGEHKRLLSKTFLKNHNYSRHLTRSVNMYLRFISLTLKKKNSVIFPCRNPRLSSIDIEQKMASRRLIKLSQLPDRLARDNLEDSDWVTFAVVINKITPQSKNNGKTFSIWKLNNLHNLEVNVSLFLFGSVHTDLWKTDTGTVIGILNPNPMKNKDGSNELCLTVDHPQKVLIMGEAMDFGTCKAKKKNGDSCTQLVNLFECQYCQYHVKAQYKKLSSKRSELQSSFTGSAPGKGRGRGSLRERLCQSDFHYGGMSSLTCAPSIKPLCMASVHTNNHANLISNLPLFNLAVAGSSVQSISASDLLKQQKEEHQQRMLARKKRAEEIQKRVLQSSAPSRPNASRGPLLSPKAASEVPKGSPGLTSRLSGPPVPTLGRGFSEGEDILLDLSPPSSKGLSAAKLAAVRKLQAKGSVMVKDDPNAVKRKRANSDDIADRVEQNLSTPKVSDENSTGEEEEPAQKKRREQLEYIQSEEFQRILNAKSSNSWMMGEERAMQEYFEPLVQKEKMEEKMKSIREMKCRAVTCKTCKYSHFKPADRCVVEKHDYHWHDAVKHFFKCPCGQRKICLARMPHGACSHCGLFKWERDGMLKEKKGPKIGGELLLPRGEEQPKFLNSLK
uniref:Protein MCM10 homolog n=1 Tax=Sinocyclocheilus anshuiensis TaxID=1608454 RepID=A0A671SLD5_9TELE